MTVTEFPVPVAIVGVGKIARDQHVPAIAASPDFTLAATVSRSGGLDGVANFDTVEALLTARPDIPALSFCTPPQVRHAGARAALAAGRHVMLEKPPGASLSEVQALAALADDRGLVLQATWHSRHAASVAAARDWLASRRVKGLRIDWKEDVRYWHPGQEWIWQAGGLGVFDPAINGLSILTAILPVPVHMAGAVLRFPANRETPIAAELDLAGPDGPLGTASLDWLFEGDPMWRITVETDAGTLVLDRGGADMRIDGGEAPQAAPADITGEYPGLYARFAELLRAGRSDVDLRPLTLVADAFMLGRREEAPAFIDPASGS